jgi:clan AA aspartic protease
MMVVGAVNARREAIVPLHVRGPDGTDLILDALVDTGCTAALTLPAKTVAALGLLKQSSGRATLADGSVRQFEIYAAEVAWTGGWRSALVAAVGEEVLLGMGLLAGHELRIVVRPGGAVEIVPLS